MNAINWKPRVLVGLEGPSFETTYPGPVGLEIKDGIGISTDGGGLVIGDSPAQGKWTITSLKGGATITVTRDAAGTHLSSGDQTTNITHDSTGTHLRGVDTHYADADITGDTSHLVYQSVDPVAKRHIEVDQSGPEIIIHGGKFSASDTSTIAFSADAITVSTEHNHHTGTMHIQKTADGMSLDAMSNPHVAMTADGFVVTTDFGFGYDVKKVG